MCLDLPILLAKKYTHAASEKEREREKMKHLNAEKNTAAAAAIAAIAKTFRSPSKKFAVNISITFNSISICLAHFLLLFILENYVISELVIKKYRMDSIRWHKYACWTTTHFNAYTDTDTGTDTDTNTLTQHSSAFPFCRFFFVLVVFLFLSLQIMPIRKSSDS